MRILIIEDDRRTAEHVIKGLSEAGHVVDHAADGVAGLNLAGASTYDVLVVDRMLPGKDGLALVELLRAAGNQTPVLVLSALADVGHRVEGLKAGADDYLVKPYAFSELLARIEALGRRRDPDVVATRLQVHDLVLDRLARTASRAGKPLTLQPREFKLLECMMQHEGQVLTRTMLLEKVWDYQFDPHTNVVDVHIARLRQKVDRGFDRPLIHTVRGAGYRLSVDP
jgi:two-component system, OmpR family, response regulator